MVQVDVPTFPGIPGSTQSPFHSIASQSVAHASTSPAPPSGHLRPQSTLPPLPRSSSGPPSAFPFVQRRPQATLPGPSQSIASLYPTSHLSRRLPPIRGSIYRIGQPHPQSTPPLPAFPQRPAPTFPPFPTPISYDTQPPVPFHSSGAGPTDQLVTQWPGPGPASGSPPTIRVTVTEGETVPVSGSYHISDHRLPLGSLPDLHRAGQTAAVSSVSSLNPNETDINRVSNPGHTSDSRMLRSMPNLRRVTPAESNSQASAPSQASTNLRELQRFPVAHRLTTFAQDLFVDAIYQQERGAWKDFDDVPAVTRLSGEMSQEVSESQSRKQSGLPEAKREKVEAGLLLSFATRSQLADSPLVFDPSSAHTRSLVSLSFDKTHWI